MPLRDSLQHALGSAYTVTRELGGGGMSRVFVAREEALQRNVVVKVLPPELLAGVSAERFNREITLAAGLQHPHIVPLLTAGQMDGVPYYTMPFVDGESLRGRLAAESRLQMTEAIGILRDVARALAYAHERGIVHRDIKPDNVLLSGGSAVVTDFGIAKAITAARSASGTSASGSLTQIGMSIGTPAYMSPEQAAADPSTDHRADIYSFGCLAYEMLAGRPPFLAKSPQKLLAAHMGEAPQPLGELRPDVPSSLSQLVMKCLAKDADDRPQRAIEIVRLLDTVTSGTGQDAMPMILAGGRVMLSRALLTYVVAFIVVAVVAKSAIVTVGLPDWVFPGALIVMGLGLPVILFTAYIHTTTRRLIGVTPTYTPGGTPSLAQGTMAQLALKASPHWSWRRAAVGGAVAVTSFVLLVGAYMGLRALGIGPAGSLFAAGALIEHERVLVADLPGPAGDTALGPVVTDAFRTALGQSQSIQVLQPQAVSEVLRRMQRPPGTPVDFALAREIATREGIKAVIDGELLGVGGRYVIALRLMSPQTGAVYATFRQTAKDQSELLPAIDALAKEVRARIGESLRAVRTAPPLEQVTTPSLEALKKYVQGVKILNETNDFERGIALLEESVALDTGFAMAYRKISIEYGNRGVTDKSDAFIEKAYAHRDRLSDAERYMLVGSYYQRGGHEDAAKSQQAYEQLLEIQPNHPSALNNLGNIYRMSRQYAKAEELYARAVRAGSPSGVQYLNLLRAQTLQGKLDAATATLDSFAKALPNNPDYLVGRGQLYWTKGQYDSVEMMVNAMAARARSPRERAVVGFARADVAALRGKVAEAIRQAIEGDRLMAQAGLRDSPLQAAVTEALFRAWFLGDTARALRILTDTISRHPPSSLPGGLAPYAGLVSAYAQAGAVDRARDILAQSRTARRSYVREGDENREQYMIGQIALASEQYDEAVRAFRAAGTYGCPICHLPLLGRAYDLGGKPDSAIATYSRFLTTPMLQRTDLDATFLPGIHKRLGELYEERGDRQLALAHYRTFIELWTDADAELQPRVTDARQRVAALTRGTDAPR